MIKSADRVQHIVQQIVGLVSPRMVVLFGSAARGTAGPDSDLDILVIVADGSSRRETAQLLYRSVQRGGVSIDIVVATESDVIAHKDHFWTVICPALRDGKVLYAA